MTQTPIDEIPAARKRAGLSQAELARKAKVGIATLKKLESGRLDPRISTVAKLLGALGACLVATPRRGAR